VRTIIRHEFDEAFKKYDVLVTPTSPTVAFKIGEKASDPYQMYLSDIYTLPVNIAGLPAISIPVGLEKGLPVGLQVIGKPFKKVRFLKLPQPVKLRTEKYTISYCRGAEDEN